MDIILIAIAILLLPIMVIIYMLYKYTRKVHILSADIDSHNNKIDHKIDLIRQNQDTKHVVQFDSKSDVPDDFKYLTDFIKPLLESIGCQPIFDSEGQLHFEFQGFKFVILGGEERSTKRLMIPVILEIADTNPSYKDILELCLDAQQIFGPKCRIDKIKDSVSNEIIAHISLMYDCIFPTNVPHPKEYIQMILDSFFNQLILIKEGLQKIKDSGNLNLKNNTGQLSQEQMN